MSFIGVAKLGMGCSEKGIDAIVAGCLCDWLQSVDGIFVAPGQVIREAQRRDGVPRQRRIKDLRMAGRSTDSGFILLGDAPTEMIETAVHDALVHEPFDPAAVDRTLAALRTEMGTTEDFLHKRILELSRTGDAETRAKLAQGFERRGGGPRGAGGPPWRGRRSGGG
ncbi:hypothetical protein B4Q13_18530, partial [Lacticaseibacillus rhamnosus]